MRRGSFHKELNADSSVPRTSRSPGCYYESLFRKFLYSSAAAYTARPVSSTYLFCLSGSQTLSYPAGGRWNSMLFINVCKNMLVDHLLLVELRLCRFPCAGVTLCEAMFCILRGLFRVVVGFFCLQTLSCVAGV